MIDKLKVNNINIDIDEEYWINQPQVILPNYSNYIIYPKQGLIWSNKTNQWIGAKNKKTGYWHCTLYSDDGKKWTTKVHRVIWIAVNGEIPNGYEVNHISEEKDINSISNLNLLTHQENINFGSANERRAKTLKNNTNRSKAISKANTNNPKLSKAVGAFKDEKLVMMFPSTMEAERLCFNHSHISSCCNGLRQSHKGFQWQYI